MKAFGEYQRLARSPLGMSSLWLGEDHLLYVRGRGFLLPFTEEYRRYRYRDIEAVTLARGAGLWAGALAYLAGLVACAALGFGLLFAREPGDTALLAATLAAPLPLAALLLALLARHLLLGPRCLCVVQTSLRRERLRPVTRLHRGREALTLLGQRIRAAQATLAPTAEEGSPAASEPLLPGAALALAVPALALPACATLGATAAALLLLLHFPHLVLSGATLLLAAAGAPLLLAALASSVRHPAPESLRQALWSLLAGVIASTATGVVYYIGQAIDDPALTAELYGPVQAFAGISALGGFAFYLIFLLLGIACLASAAAGLALAARWRARLASDFPPPPAASPPPQP